MGRSALLIGEGCLDIALGKAIIKRTKWSLVDYIIAGGGLEPIKQAISLVDQISTSITPIVFIDSDNRILEKIDNIKEGTTNEFRIDLILRCYIVIIEKHFNSFSNELNENIHETTERIAEIEKSSKKQLSDIDKINTITTEVTKQTKEFSKISFDTQNIAQETDYMAKQLVQKVSEKKFINSEEVEVV